MKDYPVNESEAAKMLGLAVQTLRNWRHIRRGPVYRKIGRRILYEPRDLQEYKDARRVDPEAIGQS